MLKNVDVEENRVQTGGREEYKTKMQMQWCGIIKGRMIKMNQINNRKDEKKKEDYEVESRIDRD